MLKHLTVIALLLIASCVIAQQRPVVHAIVNRPFTIPAARYVVYEFTVPEDATEVRVGGRFEASGGSGNDVEVIILDEDGYVNWQNHHRVRTYYYSGKLTQANIKAILPPGGGTYYLVFSNRFSVIAPKAVIAQVGLQYAGPETASDGGVE